MGLVTRVWCNQMRLWNFCFYFISVRNQQLKAVIQFGITDLIKLYWLWINSAFVCHLFSDDIFLPYGDGSAKSDIDEVDREIEEFKRYDWRSIGQVMHVKPLSTKTRHH